MKWSVCCPPLITEQTVALCQLSVKGMCNQTSAHPTVQDFLLRKAPIPSERPDLETLWDQGTCSLPPSILSSSQLSGEKRRKSSILLSTTVNCSGVKIGPVASYFFFLPVRKGPLYRFCQSVFFCLLCCCRWLLIVHSINFPNIWRTRMKFCTYFID